MSKLTVLGDEIIFLEMTKVLTKEEARYRGLENYEKAGELRMTWFLLAYKFKRVKSFIKYKL